MFMRILPSILMWLLSLGVFLAGLAGSHTDLAAQESLQTVQKRAFVVGVSHYLKDGLDHLKYGAKDAEDLANTLEELHAFNVTRLIGDQATAAAIRRSFTDFIGVATNELNRDDIVLVFFAGHGIQKVISEQDAGVEIPFFCACDSLVTKPDSMISLNWVMEQLKQSGSSNNLLIVDACRNNFDRSARSLDGSTVRELPAKLSVLFSSGPGQRAYESSKPEVPQGVFTHALLEGLQGKAASDTGEIRWLGLANYVIDRVPLEAERLAGQGISQRPNLIISSGPPIVLGWKAPAVEVVRGEVASTSSGLSEPAARIQNPETIKAQRRQAFLSGLRFILNVLLGLAMGLFTMGCFAFVVSDRYPRLIFAVGLLLSVVLIYCFYFEYDIWWLLGF